MSLAFFSFAVLSDGGEEVMAAEGSGPYVDFSRHDLYADLSSGKKNGVLIKKTATGAYVRLAGDTSRGTLTSEVQPIGPDFDTLVPSWNAATPSGTWLSVEVRVRDRGTGWSRWFSMGVWASGSGTVKRHSVNGQETPRWAVATDTLASKGRVFADAYQYRVTLASKKSGVSPKVRAVSFVGSDSYRHGDTLVPASDRSAWGKSLVVPERSQMVYPDGGEVWCSPTSLSMVMAYWAKKRGVGGWDRPVPTVADAVYDHAYRGNGNWPCKVVYASSLGLNADVSRFGSLAQAEKWTGVGVPVVASIAWSGGQLDGAAIPASAGHLLVISGFTASGDVIVNDPAAPSNSGVRRVYRRGQFFDAWMRGSGGVVYLVRPVGWKSPDRTYSGGGP